MVMQTPAQERDWWNRIAYIRDELVRNTSDMATQDCLTRIVPGLQLVAHDVVLDLGCGWGRLLTPLAVRCPGLSFVGVDSSDKAIEQGHPYPPNVELRVGDGRSLPMATGSIDKAYSMLMFQHLPPDAVAGYLREVARVLRSYGRFVFQVVNGEEDDTFLTWHYTHEWIRTACLDAGFYGLDIETDADRREWTWVTVRKP